MSKEKNPLEIDVGHLIESVSVSGGGGFIADASDLKLTLSNQQITLSMRYNSKTYTKNYNCHVPWVCEDE